MDKKLDSYIDSIVSEVLISPNFINLPEEQKQAYAVKIKEQLNSVIFDTLLNNLNSEQLNALKDLGLNTPEAQVKIEEYSAEIPNLATILEEALTKEVESSSPPSVLALDRRVPRSGWLYRNCTSRRTTLRRARTCAPCARRATTDAVRPR